MDTRSPQRRPLRTPDAEVLCSVLEVYERGQTLDALRRAEAFAPLDRWAGANGCVPAARIATNSGAPRLALRLWFAWRLKWQWLLAPLAPVALAAPPVPLVVLIWFLTHPRRN